MRTAGRTETAQGRIGRGEGRWAWQREDTGEASSDSGCETMEERGVRLKAPVEPSTDLNTWQQPQAPHRPLTGPLRAPMEARCDIGRAATPALALVVALGGCSASIGGRGASASVGTPLGGVDAGTDGSLEGSRVGVRIGRW